jgi:hypothetical protein
LPDDPYIWQEVAQRQLFNCGVQRVHDPKE